MPYSRYHRNDPTSAPPPPQRDYDYERKARLEESDRIASDVRLARRILSEFWVEGGTETQRREARIAELVASGPFSVIEADETLTQIEQEDRR